jgi:conjugal transfer pilus assembly protein TraW
MNLDNPISKLALILTTIISLFIASPIHASDFGVMGETYPIIEIDFLDFIHARIETMQKNGQWQTVQNRVRADAVQYRDRPKSIENVTRATENKNWKYDPSILLNHNVLTHDGKLIALAGTRINPLEFVPLSKTLIFYNGDDQAQVHWVMELDKKLKGRDKLILVSGSVLTQEQQFKRPIYFDQEGKLTTRFGITHVPASVSQEGLVLRINEAKL